MSVAAGERLASGGQPAAREHPRFVPRELGRGRVDAGRKHRERAIDLRERVRERRLVRAQSRVPPAYAPAAR